MPYLSKFIHSISMSRPVLGTLAAELPLPTDPKMPEPPAPPVVPPDHPQAPDVHRAPPLDPEAPRAPIIDPPLTPGLPPPISTAPPSRS